MRNLRRSIGERKDTTLLATLNNDRLVNEKETGAEMVK